ncbi:MAG: OmpA family protein [Archangium sp.]|nr:OmpA family protein [Archangium sp.]MDP3570187.1 OmpA family protein [Archangium sp.]
MKQVFLLTALLPALAFADSVNVSLTNKALKGKGTPAVHIEILEPIAGFRLVLAKDGGKPQEWKGGGRPGVTRTIELSQAEGTTKWAGELIINLPNGTTGNMPLEFETELVGPLTLTMDKDKDVDIPGRKLRFTLNQPIARVHLKVLMDTGSTIVDDDIAFDGEPAGTKLEVTWPEAKGQVLKVDLRAYAKSGVYNGVELTPWRIDIPHEEVNFASGKWDVSPEEAAKLESSLTLILAAIDKFGSLAEIKLFIAGHTDTVGANASNRTLSLNRARSIGAWFRKKGVRIPVRYEGFGEEALLVSTNDETAEAKNRRAEYIIAIDDPTTKSVPFQPNWQRL